MRGSLRSVLGGGCDAVTVAVTVVAVAEGADDADEGDPAEVVTTDASGEVA